MCCGKSQKALVRLCVGTDCETVGPTRGRRATTKAPGTTERLVEQMLAWVYPIEQMLTRSISCTSV